MHRNEFNTNYRAMCPEISSEVEDFLNKSDKQLEYQDYERKRLKIAIGYKRLSVEDSLDRLTEIGEQFVAPDNVEEEVINKIMLQKLASILQHYPAQERNAVEMVFLEDKKLREAGKTLHIPKSTLQRHIKEILAQLKKDMEK